MLEGFRYYRDPQGRQVAIVTTQGRRGTTVHHAEVIERGEVIDCFTLYGDHALFNTAQRRNWALQREIATA